MKILLTGAQGQVGHEIAKKAQQMAIEILAFTQSELDIRNTKKLDKIIETSQADILINAAAYTAVDKAEQEPDQAFAINRDGVKNLAHACQKFNLPLIHISTDYVFDGNKAQPYTEEDRCSPLNIYGQSKLAGETLLQQIWEKHVIVRTSWVFGKQGHNFVKTILKLAATQSELKIVSDQIGCPTPAPDLATILLRLADQLLQPQPTWGIFHYCSSKPTSWYEFAKYIINYGQQYFPLQIKAVQAIPSSEFPTPAKRPQYSILSTEKIKHVYGIQPADWKQGLEQIIQDLAQGARLYDNI